MSNTAFGNAEATSSRVEVASLGRGVRIEGKIYSAQDLLVDGEVAGTIELPNHKLTVGPHGRIKADIKAHEILMLGTVEGSVQVQEKVEVRSTTQFVGDIKASRMILEEGAYVKGSIDIVRTETSKPMTTSQVPSIEPPQLHPATTSNFQGALPN